jgi:two-component system response regulator LytT
MSGAGRLRALVVEDEWPAREYLIELLLGTGQVDVVAAVATAAEARQALGPEGVDVEVAFVDINLVSSGGSEAGLPLVREQARRPGSPLFVLATAWKQHAAEAYELDVVDYLGKPFSEERVRECVARVLRRRPHSQGAPAGRVVARSKHGLVFLRPQEVLAFEASERLSFVHAREGRFDVDLSLAALEASLGPAWLRVHRNWLVNQEHVGALERDELGTILVVGSAEVSLRVPVARDKLQKVRETLLSGATGIRR